MKIFHATRFGNDTSPEGPNGEDTHFLVRAKDRTQAARMVDKYLRHELTHRKVEAKCHRIQELGRDASSVREPAIVAGPWYAILPCQIDGYTVWAREVHTGYRWVDAHKWFQGTTSRTRKSTVRLRRP